ncbi:cytoplasmic tRNA 2-thiolation protein 1 [Strigomonas culicis]|uniref:Cytoplasmic tRNA 2-thiolation protein 1 n=1 Tax=Strigomonas culicis TaxID=28005 RepID=S9UQ36_9TRYP|nr:cytoplasmic tRNA 2-thiolation protein 1 [Strigomonas culicis]EPY30983.1 cytoplasmic tRNA 2-thiolation protein 1 [Strigomonas culicis]EPY31315.1 cytoplasmic tRNA 2-thiolation protein 1 [Strigomonas culicis]|eukprot:EPY19955.1 cytoplasmic tRNA 2-thiolation protein 1 [Strigomonas culicis]
MPPKLCENCNGNRASLRRPKNGHILCQECFFSIFETEVHETIVKEELFQPNDVVALGASGGKDSTVLIHLMTTLNERYQYGLQLILVSIDEGIVGYRDDSLETVKRNSSFYKLPLHILSYKELYGWTMDEIVNVSGLRNSCTFCGVFRRQALEKGSLLTGASKIVTGHNADDMAETILMNFFRADAPRLARSTCAISGGKDGTIARVKPLKYAYEKEIVLYAHFKKLDYFTTECTYSKDAFRGTARALLKEMEAVRPRCIADIVATGESLCVREVDASPGQAPRPCSRCGFVTSQRLCRACVLLQSLQQGNPLAALRNTVVE